MLTEAFESVLTAGRPAILWVEEIDYIATSKQQSAKSPLFYSFLAHLDNKFASAERALVIATTNRLSEVDKSLRRGGRLDLDVRFDMPSAQDRLAIMQAHLDKISDRNSSSSVQVSIDEAELTNIANASSGFVSSDLA